MSNVLRRILCCILVASSLSCTDSPGNMKLPEPGRSLHHTSSSQYSQNSITNTLGMRFVLIPSGSFSLGMPVESGGLPDENPVSEALIPKAFYFCDTEVTQRQWLAVMGTSPSIFSRVNIKAIQNVYNAHVSSKISENNPVECVSWNDVKEFIRRINAIDNEHHYRLPTESEWEYAAKAGREDYLFPFQNKFAVLSGTNSLYSSMRGGITFPVKSFQPNAWGLYDMDGNVREWCEDEYRPYGAPDQSTNLKVNRGPCWIDPQNFRITQRYCNFDDFRAPFLGFRLVMSPLKQKP